MFYIFSISVTKRSLIMAKRFISKKDLDRVKELDLLTYLQNYEPQELVKKGRNDYVTQTHGSLHISNGLWCWWAKGIGGKTALKYLIEVEEWDFLEAANYLKDLIDKQPPISVKQTTRATHYFYLPRQYENNDRVIDYLVNVRKIDREIINECIKKHLIYEAKKDHSAVFVGYDENHKAMFASKRSINSNLKMNIYGSDKRYSFSIKNKQHSTLHIFESPIDLLSYMTLEKMKKKNYMDANYLSINGAALIGKNINDTHIPVALEYFLNNNSQISQLALHLDNDQAGHETAKKIKFHLSDSYDIIDCSPKYCKDINEILQRKIKKVNKEIII